MNNLMVVFVNGKAVGILTKQPHPSEVRSMIRSITPDEVDEFIEQHEVFGVFGQAYMTELTIGQSFDSH